MTPFDVAQGRRIDCPREHEVFEALGIDGSLAGRPELQAHADACDVCRDIVAVAVPLMAEKHVALERAHPPTSGVVWFRAQMRARQEAARAATRPITVVQGIALVSFVAVFASVMGVLSPRLLAWFRGLGFPTPELSLGLPQFELTSLVPTTTFGMALAGICVLFLILWPLAAYLALRDE